MKVLLRLLAFEVPGARDIARAAARAAVEFPVRRRRHVLSRRTGHDVVAQRATRVGDAGVEQDADGFEAEAARTTRLALACISRPERRSTKLTPLARPVFLSTVTSRTTAFWTSIELAGGQRLGQQHVERAGVAAVALARGGSSSPACRVCLAAAANAARAFAVGRIVVDEVAVGKLRPGLPCAAHAEDRPRHGHSRAQARRD